MTKEEKINSLPHINTIKNKIKDEMWFKTDDPNIVLKASVTWETIDLQDRENKKLKLQQEKQIAISEIEMKKNDIEAMQQHYANTIQAQIDTLDMEHEEWQ